MKAQVRAVLGILLSVLLLWWALRDVSFAEVARRIRDADFALFGLAIAIAVAAFWIRALRWGVHLLPVAGRIPFRPRLAATFIGFGLNNVLPARVGEFARVYALVRLTKVRAGAAFATLVIERLFDGIVLVGLLFAAMAAPGFPVAGDRSAAFRSGALAVALGMAGLGIALYLAVAAPRRAGALARLIVRVLPERMREPALGALRSFAAGLALLRSPRLFLVAAALALGQWVFLAFSFLYAFRAFGIEVVPFSGALFLQSLISLAVAIPSSPGFFGPFEAGARVGLGLWGVGGDQAISFAIGFHLAGFIPVTVIGLYYIWRLDLGWKAVSRAEASVEDALESGAPAPARGET